MVRLLEENGSQGHILGCIEGPIQYIVFDVFNDAVRQNVNAHKLQRKREITLLCKSHHLENLGDFGKNTTTNSSTDI